MECRSSVNRDVWGVSIECLSSVDQRYPSRVSINTHSELTVDAFSTYDPLLIMTIIMITVTIMMIVFQSVCFPLPLDECFSFTICT